MPSARSTSPLWPNAPHGDPVAASSAISRASMVPTKIRRRQAWPTGTSGSSQVDTPHEVITP
jgi:hypothetical protein